MAVSTLTTFAFSSQPSVKRSLVLPSLLIAESAATRPLFLLTAESEHSERPDSERSERPDN